MPSPYIRLIPTIDPANVATCLACPLPLGCVYTPSGVRKATRAVILSTASNAPSGSGKRGGRRAANPRELPGAGREAWRRKRDLARAKIAA